jgi:hypothetical protein
MVYIFPKKRAIAAMSVVKAFGISVSVKKISTLIAILGTYLSITPRMEK